MEIQATRIFYEIANSNNKIIVNIGGARSGKSYASLQFIAYLLVNEKNKKILIARKTRPALKMTCFEPFQELLSEWGLLQFCNVNKSDLEIKFNSNIVYFKSIDKITKMKSTEFNYILMEESDEFSVNEYIILKTRLSGKTESKNKVIINLNPVDCWVKGLLENPEERKEIHLIKSTYKDNPFLQKDYIDILEGLKFQDETMYKIYCLGEFSSLPNIIYNNWDIISDEEYDKIQSEKIYGIDFGFNAPTAMVEVKFSDGQIYVRELLYKQRLLTSDIISFMAGNITNHKSYIFGDSEDPRTIQEIYNAGYNIQKSDKEVFEGINFIKRFRVKITESSPNLIKEIKTYSWKQDKDKNLIDEPIKFNDHLLDAIRYAVYTWGLKYGKLYIPEIKQVKPLNAIEKRIELEKQVSRINKMITGQVKHFKIIK
jgi:phage terminase large subunit